jgi:hypothetical protein
LSRASPLLFCATETWLSSDQIDNAIVHLPNYEIIRSDRDGLGGGAGIIFNTALCSVSSMKSITLMDYNVIQARVNLLSQKNMALNVICCYLPPTLGTIAADRERILSFVSSLDTVLSNKLPNILLGDFNLRNIHWHDPQVIGHNAEHIFTRFILEHGLHQLVTEPTRSQSNIDWLFTDCIDLITNVRCAENFSTSDHYSVVFDLFLRTKDPISLYDENVPQYNFKAADWNLINSILSQVNWNTILSRYNTIQQAWETMYDVLYHAIDLGVPKKTKPNRKKGSDGSLHKLRLKKRKAWRNMKRHPFISDYKVKFKQTAFHLKQAIKKFHAKRQLEILGSNDKGSFYKYVNARLNKSPKLSCLVKGNGDILSDSQLIAEELNNYFASVYTLDNGLDDDFPLRNGAGEISTILFDIRSVTKTLNNLKASTSTSPDGIPNIFLKNTSASLSFPLAYLFERSMIENFVPKIWKIAKVIPIHKKGSTTCTANYRPISLTSSISKVMERIIVDQLSEYLKCNNLLSTQQYGFLKNSSTIDQLLDSHLDWVNNQNNGIATDVIFLDFSKAFDSVVHTKLLVKLTGYGIQDDLLRWIQNFLSCRTHFTTVKNAESSTKPVISGVPQGSVLGPLLFVIYINDLPLEVEEPVVCKLFADDGKIYNKAQDIGDCLKTQRSLSRVALWSLKWLLPLNIAKCFALHLGRGNFHHKYHINGCTLPSENSAVDLGITISSDQTYHLHINKILAKCHQRLYLAKMCFVTSDPAVTKLLFTTYIRPILEYGSVLWNPHSSHEVSQLENIQNKFLKQANLAPNQCDLASLETRRANLDLLLYYKIMSNSSRLNSTKFFTRKCSGNRQNHSLTLSTPIIHTSAYQNFFNIRQIHRWNMLPSSTIDVATSYSSFKNRLLNIY